MPRHPALLTPALLTPALLAAALLLTACAGAPRLGRVMDLADRRWQTLSGGERQRVQLARALAQDVYGVRTTIDRHPVADRLHVVWRA